MDTDNQEQNQNQTPVEQVPVEVKAQAPVEITLSEIIGDKGNKLFVTYRRNPTESEIKFGYGTTHYKYFSQRFCSNRNGTFKKWLTCPSDNLRYMKV